MNWNQPVCYDCWDWLYPDKLVAPDRKTNAGPHEKCCLCGTITRSGIYIRIDPRTVKFPSE